MSVASFAASFSCLMTFLRDGIDSYSSAKSSSTATPSLLFGRSRMWPIDAMTLKSRPRYLLMVFAFAGDSTTTSAFPIRSISTLARSVNPHESSAAHSRDFAAHFELEQTRQQFRRRQPRTLCDRVEIARFTRGQRREHGVERRGRTPFSARFVRKKGNGPFLHPQLFQDI